MTATSSALVPTAAHPTKELRVKGSSIRSKLLYVRATFGPDAEEGLKEHLRSSSIHQVLDGSWYPFEIYDDCLRWIAARFLEGDLRRLTEAGEFSADQSLTTTYEVYTLKDFAHFLSRLSTLHSRFYSEGVLENDLDEAGHHCLIRLHGAPYYSDADLYVACGFFQGAARIMGLDGAQCLFEKTDSGVRMDLRWNDS